MYGQIVGLAVAVLGIDVGWQPLPEGGVQYLIQIEPHMLDTLRSGEPLQSDVPPQVARDVRAYRISVGSGPLPRELPAAEAALPANATPQSLRQPDLLSQSLPGPLLEPPGASAEPSETPLRAEPARSWPRESPLFPSEGPIRPREEPRQSAPTPSWPTANAPLEPLPSSGPPAVPRTLDAVPASKPLTDGQVVFASTDPIAPKAEESQAEEPDAKGPGKPWFPLTLALLALFASLGGNVFLLWIAGDFRRRYRELLMQAGEPATE